MANTRNRNANNNNDGENSNAGNPPPTLEQVLVMQANHGQYQQHQQAPQPQQRDRLGDFQRTKPLHFSHSVESMDADDWLKTVEKKLQLVQCNNREKVMLASHHPIGPAAD
jgi:isochorismate synthase EntC